MINPFTTSPPGGNGVAGIGDGSWNRVGQGSGASTVSSFNIATLPAGDGRYWIDITLALNATKVIVMDPGGETTNLHSSTHTWEAGTRTNFTSTSECYLMETAGNTCKIYIDINCADKMVYRAWGFCEDPAAGTVALLCQSAGGSNSTTNFTDLDILTSDDSSAITSYAWTAYRYTGNEHD